MSRYRIGQFLIALFWIFCASAAQAQTGCALNPKTVTINQTLGSSSIDVGLVVAIWCGTASGTSKNINGTLTGPGGGGNLTRTGGTETVGYSVFRGQSGIVSASPTKPSSCNGMTAWNSAVNFSVTVQGGSSASPVMRYMAMCIRIAAATSMPSGDYVASPALTVSPFQSGALASVGINGTQTISITGNIPGTCTVQAAPNNITLDYPAFSANSVVQTTTSTIRCTSNLSWSAAVSPSSGTLRGIEYSIGISSPSPATGKGTGNNQSLTIRATASAGQKGNTNCTTPCSIEHALTISY